LLGSHTPEALSPEPALPPGALGIGTEHVESLTSYVARLADAHAVSILTLILHEINPVITGSVGAPIAKKRYSQGYTMLPSRGSFFLNGSGHGARNWVRVLGQLTAEQSLRHLTALCWGGAVSSDEVVWRHRAWCSQCYQQGGDIEETVRFARERLGIPRWCNMLRRRNHDLAKWQSTGAGSADSAFGFAALKASDGVSLLKCVSSPRPAIAPGRSPARRPPPNPLLS
jgi:hypothetical protein